MDNINYHDFLNMCRTCMLDIDLKPIEDKTIIETLEIITDKNFKTNDELPQQICGMCIKKILDLNHFIKQCRISEDNFKVCLANFRNECPSVTIDPGDKPMEVYVVETPGVEPEKERVDPKTNKNVNFDNIINDMRKEFDVPPTGDPLNIAGKNPGKTSKTPGKSVDLTSGEDAERETEDFSDIQDDDTAGLGDTRNDDPAGPGNAEPSKTSDPNQCDVCGRIFATSSTLLRHKQIHARVFSFKCDKCEKTFSEEAQLKKHERSHEINRFECSVCKKDCKNGGNLSRHERTHTGAKPFRCAVCQKRFSNSSNLIKHKRIHDGLKPYKCVECDKEFRTSSHLAAHKSVHGTDNFECDVCDKSYRSENHLKRHMKTHCRDKVYTCKFCDKTFPYTSSLLNHMKKIHGK